MSSDSPQAPSPRPARRFHSLQTRLALSFGLAALLILVTLLYMGLFGVPLTPYRGRAGDFEAEAAAHVTSLAERKEERLRGGWGTSGTSCPSARLFPARHAGAIAAEGRRSASPRRGFAARPSARGCASSPIIRHSSPASRKSRIPMPSIAAFSSPTSRPGGSSPRPTRPTWAATWPASPFSRGRRAGTAISWAMSAWWAARVPLLACPAVLETRLGKPTVAPAIPSVHPRKSPSSTSPARCSRPRTASSR